MANSSKNRGDRAERELAERLSALLGLPVRRKLGAGRRDDTGDLDGLDGHVLQVADWKDVARAALHKPRQAQIQAGHAGCAFASSFVRFRGGQWRVVLTLEQWSAIITRSSPEDSHSASLQRHRPDAATRPRL